MPRPAPVRYTGLAGSLLLAAAAYYGGANSPWSPTVTAGTFFGGASGVLVPAAWPAGTLLLIGAWWVGRRDIPSARWAYVTAALWVVPLLPFLPLGSYDIYSYACQGWQQAAGLDPYAGGVDQLGCPWAAAVSPTWRAAPAPYGPVFLLLAAVAAEIGGSLTGTVAVLRVVALLGVVLIAVSLPALTRRTGVPLRRAVWLALACPLIPVHLVSGAHNDAVMMGFLVAGLAVATTRWPWAAGVLLGLAVGVKATAAVAIPFALLVAYRSAARSRPDGDRRAMGGAAELMAGVIVTLGVVSLASGRGLGWVTGLTGSGASVQWTSPSTAVGMTISLLGVNAVPVTRVTGLVVLAVVLVRLWWRALRGADVWRNTGYAMAATVVLSPVFHPWYATWALVLLAATLRRETRWVVAPAAVTSALCLPDGYNLALAVKTQGAVAMTALLGYLGYLGFRATHAAESSDPHPAGPDHAGDQLSRRDA